MSKFQVGQKWKTRSGSIVAVVYINDIAVVVEGFDGRVFGLNKSGKVYSNSVTGEDLVEQLVEPKYRPFASAAEFELNRNRWLVNSGSGRFKVTWYSDSHVFVAMSMTWKDAFEKYTFEDGTPFGIKVKHD